MSSIMSDRRVSQSSFSSIGFLAACILPAVCLVTPAQGAQTLRGLVPQAVAHATLVGRMPPSTRLNLSISLPLRNQEALDLFIESVNDPSSSNYHRYLTSAEFAEQYGPAETDYQALIAFAQAQGLVVIGTPPNRAILNVSGDAGTIEKAFHTNLAYWADPVRGKFYAPDRDPTLDLDVKITAIAGLDNYDLPHPMSLTAVPLKLANPLVTGSGPGGLFIGKDFRAAYAPNVTLDGTGQAVGLCEFDGFYPSDLTANFKQAGLTPVPAQTVLLDGFSGSPGAGNIEVILDIAMAGYMAPNATKILVYEGYYPNDVLNRMATDNLASQLSSSWGFGINAATEQIFKQFIAQGQSFYQASGDSGAYHGSVMTPSDDPNVTVVGGTSLMTTRMSGPWLSESTWSGSGGGISTTYAIPSYQQGLSMAVNGGSLTMRNIPDVGLTADIQMFLICNNGQQVSVGGTSAAAPLWAGFTALANQKGAGLGKARIGFMNPLIYSIGKGARYVTDFHDITFGNNSGFSAVVGYDLATGWGTPAGQPLIDDLLGVSSQPGFNISPSASTLSLNAGSTGASTITVVQQNGFTGSVAFVATGMPAGVTATWSAASSTSMSTLTLAAASSAVAGTSAITITGTSGTLKSTATISLVVATPNFSITASAASMTVNSGANGASTVTVVPQGGFTGSVGFVATGMPTGVTATWSPASTTSKSTLTLAAASSAVAGTSVITITGTSGTLKSTASISLAVVAPNFGLSLSAATLTLLKGATVTNGVSVVALGGFTGSVSLTASGLPAGVTAAFSPVSASGASVLTLTAGTTAVAAISTVSVTGASGALSHTAAISLNVMTPTAGSLPVILASMYNVTAAVKDGTTFPPIGLDGGSNGVGTAYSANLLGPQQTLTGTNLYLGPAGVPNGISGKNVPLTSGQYATIKLLGTGVNGNQVSQSFAVTYTDGTSTTFVQSLSDWFSPASFSGETRILSMPYRDTDMGVADNRTFWVYGYSFNLNAAKKVSSITLPNNRNVVVLAITLGGAATQSAVAVPVSLSAAYDTIGIRSEGKPFTGGLDGVGYAYSASLLGTAQTVNNVAFTLGAADAVNFVSGTGKAIALPTGNFSGLQLLATGVNGSQLGQTFKVTYTDGTTASVTQSLSDWFKPQSFPGESVAITMAHRVAKTGLPDNGPYYVYGYTLPLNNAKTVASITLPANNNVKVAAMTLIP